MYTYHKGIIPCKQGLQACCFEVFVMAEVPSTPIILSPRTPVNSEYSIVEVSPYHKPVIVYPAKATPLPPLPSQESPRMNKVSFPANTHKVSYLSTYPSLLFITWDFIFHTEIFLWKITLSS